MSQLQEFFSIRAKPSILKNQSRLTTMGLPHRFIPELSSLVVLGISLFWVGTLVSCILSIPLSVFSLLCWRISFSWILRKCAFEANVLGPLILNTECFSLSYSLLIICIAKNLDCKSKISLK